MYLMGMYLIAVYFMGVHLGGMYLIGVNLVSMYRNYRIFNDRRRELD
jgi:hypothetical protein